MWVFTHECGAHRGQRHWILWSWSCSGELPAMAAGNWTWVLRKASLLTTEPSPSLLMAFLMGPESSTNALGETIVSLLRTPSLFPNHRVSLPKSERGRHKWCQRVLSTFWNCYPKVAESLNKLVLIAQN